MRDPTLYVPSHVGIWTHRKFLRLVRRLAIDERIVHACLHSLWGSAASQTTDGDLRGWDVFDIATAARWHADAVPFVEALIAEGWIETDGTTYRIHDWEKYAGDWMAKREARLEGWRENKRAKRGTKADVPINNGGQPPMSPGDSVTKADVTNREERIKEDQRGEETIPERALPVPVTKPLTGDELAAVRQRNGIAGKRGVFGMAEAESKPVDVDGLIALHGKALAARWGPDCAPDLRTMLAGVWGSYSANYDKWGPGDALARLEGLLAKNAKEQRDRAARGVVGKVDASVFVPTPRAKPRAQLDAEHDRHMARVAVARVRGVPLPPHETDKPRELTEWQRDHADVEREALASMKAAT